MTLKKEMAKENRLMNNFKRMVHDVVSGAKVNVDETGQLWDAQMRDAYAKTSAMVAGPIDPPFR